MELFQTRQINPTANNVVAFLGNPPTGLRRKSLEAVRFLARKTQKMHQLPFENYSPSTTSRDRTSMRNMSRIPRRRSLSLLTAPGCGKEDSPKQLAFLSQECAGAQQTTPPPVIRFGAIHLTEQRRRQRHHRDRVKSTILEEHSSQLDPSSSNFPTSVYSSGTTQGDSAETPED